MIVSVLSRPWAGAFGEAYAAGDMGYIRFRRSLRIAPGLKLNFGKTGVSATVGGRGAHFTVHSSGRRTTTVGLPGSGLSYIDRSSAGRGRPAQSPTSGAPALTRSSPTSATPPEAWAAAPSAAETQLATAAVPHPGIFASAAERAFHAGVLAYLTGQLPQAVTDFHESAAADPSAVSPHLLAAVALTGQAQLEAAIPDLEQVVQAATPLPDHLISKYLPGPILDLPLRVQVTETVSVVVALDRAGAVLLLAEAYQAAGRLSEGIGIVQQLQQTEPADPVVRLSLADLLFADDDYQGAAEATVGADNTDDVGLATLQIRAAALFAEGDHDAAFEVFRLALARTAGRSPELLMAIRYDRAIAYGLAGQPAKSKADLSRLLAIDPTYRDVQQRLSAFQAGAGEGGSTAASGAPGAGG